MFNFKQLYSRMSSKALEEGAERSRDQDSENSSTTYSPSRDDLQAPAEGFICPKCMKALGSKELLEEHYATEHEDKEEGSPSRSSALSPETMDLERTIEALQLRLSAALEENEELKATLKDFEDGLFLDTEEPKNLKTSEEHEKQSDDEITKKIASEVDQRVAAFEASMVSVEKYDEAVNNFSKEEERLTNMPSETQQKLAALESFKEQVISDFKNFKNNSIKEQNSYVDQIKQLQKDLEMATNDKEDLKTSTNILEVEIQEAQKKYDELLKAKRSDDAVSELATIVAEKQGLEKHCSQLKEECNRFGLVAEDMRGKVAELEKELEAAKNTNKQEIQKIQQALSDAQSIIQRLEIEKNEHKAKTESSDSAKAILETKLTQLETEMSSKKEEIEAANDKIKKLGEELERKNTKISSIKTEYDAECKKLNDRAYELSCELKQRDIELDNSVQENDIIRKKLEAMKNQAEQIKKDTEKEIEKLNKEFSQANEMIKKKSIEFENQKTEWSSKLENLQSEIERLKIKLKKTEEKSQGFENEVTTGQSNYQALLVESEKTKVELEAMNSERDNLENKLKSAEEEKSLLFGRCMTREGEVENYQKKVESLEKRLDDTNAALQELARENQSLQMDLSKQQNRRWAPDDMADKCHSCSRDFSLTVRKHHCRICGQIFCNDCSSKNVTIPPSKKAVRVCDDCFTSAQSEYSL